MGERGPQCRTTVIKLNIISMGASSFYRNPLENEEATLGLLGAGHDLADFLATLLEKRLPGSQSSLCRPLLVCTTPMGGIDPVAAKYFNVQRLKGSEYLKVD